MAKFIFTGVRNYLPDHCKYAVSPDTEKLGHLLGQMGVHEDLVIQANILGEATKIRDRMAHRLEAVDQALAFAKAGMEAPVVPEPPVVRMAAAEPVRTTGGRPRSIEPIPAYEPPPTPEPSSAAVLSDAKAELVAGPKGRGRPRS